MYQKPFRKTTYHLFFPLLCQLSLCVWSTLVMILMLHQVIYQTPYEAITAMKYKEAYYEIPMIFIGILGTIYSSILLWKNVP